MLGVSGTRYLSLTESRCGITLGYKQINSLYYLSNYSFSSNVTNYLQTKCAWYPQHDYQIFRNFELNARYMLNDILGSALEKNQKPDWMLEAIWARFNEKWTTAKFQNTSIQAKASWASNKGDSLHIEGLASIGTHQRKSVTCLLNFPWF